MNKFWRIIKKTERGIGKLQGRGYTPTIQQEVKMALAALGKRPHLVYDIGANVGDYTVNILNSFPSAEIHLFEPSISNNRHLTKRFSDNKNIKIQPFAISSSQKMTELYQDKEGSGLASLNKRRLDHHGINFDQRQPVNCITLDNYIRLNPPADFIDIIKMDIEGHEFDALKGAQNTLSLTRVVQFEFGGASIDGRIFFQDIWYLLKDHFYEIYRMTPLGLLKIEYYNEYEEHFVISNYVAVKDKKRLGK